MANFKIRTALPDAINQEYIDHAPESTPEAIAALKTGISASIKQLLKAPPKIRVWEWAERERRFGASKYRQSKVEVARGPMSWATEPGVREIAIRGPTQLLKTTILENVFGYFAQHDPCPMVLFEPIEALVHGFIREKLNPMVRDTDSLRSLIRPARGREGDSTATWKVFPGGSLTVAAARSASNLAMLPFRIALMDEVDKYVSTVEGNAIELAKQRLTSFPNNSLFLQVCSPTTEDGQITVSYEAGDRRQGVCECPACDFKQTLEWGGVDSKHGVKWPKSKDIHGSWVHHTEQAGYACAAPECSHIWSNLEWRRAINGVRFYQTKSFICCGVEQHPEKRFNSSDVWEWDDWAQVHYALCSECGRRAVPNRIVSGTVSNLYSPHKSLPGLAEKFLRVKGDPEKLKVFVNTDLAEPFVDKGEDVDLGSLKNRRRVWSYDLPDGAHFYGLSVDTQKNRLEVLRFAFNIQTEQMWLIDHRRLFGDTKHDQPWDALDEMLKEKLVRSDGKAFLPAGCIVDIAGSSRDRAMRFCQKNAHRNVLACFGKAEKNGQRSELFPTKIPKLNGRFQIPVYSLSVSAAKDTLQGHLAVHDPSLPRFVHISANISDEFIDQIGAETPVPTRIAGKWTTVWTPKHHNIRNEGLDLCGYARCMLNWIHIVDPIRLQGVIFKPIRTQEIVTADGEILTPDEAHTRALEEERAAESVHTETEKKPARRPAPKRRPRIIGRQ